MELNFNFGIEELQHSLPVYTRTCVQWICVKFFRERTYISNIRGIFFLVHKQNFRYILVIAQSYIR